MYSHNSSANQLVTTYNFGPAPRLNNVTAAVELGFELAYGTGFFNWCPGNPMTQDPAHVCVDRDAYCAATPPYATLYRSDGVIWSSAHYPGDMYFTIPSGVSGLRLKVQRTYNHDNDPNNGPSTVRLNGATLWSASNCASSCPDIVTATVEPGDVLSFSEIRDTLAIFWIELWQHTRWPTAVLPTSGVVYIRGRLCATCPTNYSGPTCLPTPVDTSSSPPPPPPPPATSKQVT